jgi:hypothetical protein
VSWRAALEAAVRSEFRATPLVPPPGSPLLPAACAVPGCVRTGFTAPWGRFQARLCHGHADRWIADGRPADSTGWVAVQTPLLVMAPTTVCDVAGCPRSAAKGGLCRAHDRQWHDRGKPPLDGFVRSAAAPRRVLTGICRAPDCEFPAGDRLGLCDRHINTFHAWRHHRVRVGDPDPSIGAYLENVNSHADGTAHVWLELPDRELLELELRFVIQAMHDHGKRLIAQARWRELVRELNALGVESLLDHDLDWWDAHRPAGCDRAPRWLCYLTRGWRALFAFRARAGLDDPWAHDLWYIGALPIDRAVKHIRTLDWRPVRPGWLRELAKRWARHKLRNGISLVHVTAVRLATVRFGEFCEEQGWPLDSAGCLSRELFDAFLDHVRCLRTGVAHNSPASIPLWINEANRLRRLLPKQVQETLARHEDAGTTDSEEYQQAMMCFYERHLCRIVPFPDELQRTFAQLEEDPTVYHTMNGPSEFHVIGTLRDWNLTPRLHEIRVPVLVISGEHDEAAPTVVRPLVAGLPDATWELLDGASHSTHLERRDRFLELVSIFLASHD